MLKSAANFRMLFSSSLSKTGKYFPILVSARILQNHKKLDGNFEEHDAKFKQFQGEPRCR